MAEPKSSEPNWELLTPEQDCFLRLVAGVPSKKKRKALPSQPVLLPKKSKFTTAKNGEKLHAAKSKAASAMKKHEVNSKLATTYKQGRDKKKFSFRGIPTPEAMEADGEGADDRHTGESNTKETANEKNLRNDDDDDEEKKEASGIPLVAAAAVAAVGEERELQMKENCVDGNNGGSESKPTLERPAAANFSEKKQKKGYQYYATYLCEHANLQKFEELKKDLKLIKGEVAAGRLVPRFSELTMIERKESVEGSLKRAEEVIRCQPKPFTMQALYCVMQALNCVVDEFNIYLGAHARVPNEKSKPEAEEIQQEPRTFAPCSEGFALEKGSSDSEPAPETPAEALAVFVHDDQYTYKINEKLNANFNFNMDDIVKFLEEEPKVYRDYVNSMFDHANQQKVNAMKKDLELIQGEAAAGRLVGIFSDDVKKAISKGTLSEARELEKLKDYADRSINRATQAMRCMDAVEAMEFVNHAVYDVNDFIRNHAWAQAEKSEHEASKVSADCATPASLELHQYASPAKVMVDEMHRVRRNRTLMVDHGLKLTATNEKSACDDDGANQVSGDDASPEKGENKSDGEERRMDGEDDSPNEVSCDDTSPGKNENETDGIESRCESDEDNMDTGNNSNGAVEDAATLPHSFEQLQVEWPEKKDEPARVVEGIFYEHTWEGHSGKDYEDESIDMSAKWSSDSSDAESVEEWTVRQKWPPSEKKAAIVRHLTKLQKDPAMKCTHFL